MASIFDPLLNDPDDPTQNKALIGALRRQQDFGTLGQLMGIEPTAQAGQSMQRGAQQSFSEAMQARQQAQQRKMQQAQMQAEAGQRAQQQRNWEAQQREQTRQFGIEQARLADQQKRQFAVATDPITGTSRMYNTFTGEWKDERGGTPPGADAGGNGRPMGPTGFPQLPAGIKLPENATKSYIGASQLAEHLPALESMIAGGYTPSRTDLMAVGPPLSGTGGRVQDLTPRGLANPQGQQYFAIGGKILTAILRPESGGAITADEWNQYGPLYLPWPGDDPQTVQKKEIALREYMRRLAAASGHAATYFVEPAEGRAPRAPGQPFEIVGPSPTQGQRPGDKYME